DDGVALSHVDDLHLYNRSPTAVVPAPVVRDFSPAGILTSCTTGELIPQGFPGLERVTDSFERLRLAAQLEKRLSFEVQEVCLADSRLVRERTAGQNVRQRPADDRVEIANPACSPGEVNAELQRREHPFAAYEDRGSRRRRTVTFAHALECGRL